MTPHKSTWPFPAGEPAAAARDDAAPIPELPSQKPIEHATHQNSPASRPVEVDAPAASAEGESQEDRGDSEIGAASGGTRTRAGSNYGDWRPNEPPTRKGYDGSARSGDWRRGEKDSAAGKQGAQELDGGHTQKDG